MPLLLMGLSGFTLIPLILYILVPGLIPKDRDDEIWGLWMILLMAPLGYILFILYIRRFRARTTSPFSARFAVSIEGAKKAVETYLKDDGLVSGGEGRAKRYVTEVIGNETKIVLLQLDHSTTGYVWPIPIEGREEFMEWLDGLTDALLAAR